MGTVHCSVLVGLRSKNAWNKFINDENPKFDLEGIEDFHGAFGADPSYVHDWLNKDEVDFRYQNLTEEETAQRFKCYLMVREMSQHVVEEQHKRGTQTKISSLFKHISIILHNTK
jgi:hypothetical protein